MSTPEQPRRRPGEPGPLDPVLVHWPMKAGREELMVETLPGLSRGLVEHLVRELLAQSGLDAEPPSEEAMTVSLLHGVSPIRVATMTFESAGAVYTVLLEQNRVTVLPKEEYHQFLIRRMRRDRA